MASDYKKYVCAVCQYVYDEELGDAESDIPPGTLWADVPESWLCPKCGVSKDNFQLMQE